MNINKFRFSIVITFIFFSILSFAQGNAEPWRADQLIEPADLAAILERSDSAKPLIISVGPAGLIKGSIQAGDANEKKNLNKLRSLLRNQSKQEQIVIYCGCCPFKDCPNIRPAFRLLNEMKFVNHKLLNLRNNIKVDWLNKGFSINENNETF